MAGATASGDQLTADRRREGPAPRGSALFTSLRRLLPALLVSVLLAGCGSDGPISLGPDNKGTSVTIEIGEVVEVSLPSNPSTGYAWHLREELNEEIVQVQSSDYVPDEESEGLAGGGGTEVWRFLGTGPGETAVAMAYYFGDEPEKESNEFSFSVTVDAVEG